MEEAPLCAECGKPKSPHGVINGTQRWNCFECRSVKSKERRAQKGKSETGIPGILLDMREVYENPKPYARDSDSIKRLKELYETKPNEFVKSLVAQEEKWAARTIDEGAAVGDDGLLKTGSEFKIEEMLKREWDLFRSFRG